MTDKFSAKTRGISNLTLYLHTAAGIDFAKPKNARQREPPKVN
jgi:hypothetical protein